MEATKNCFVRDRVTPGRFMRHILRRKDVMIVFALVSIPIALIVLSVYVFSSAIHTLEEIVGAIFRKEEER